MLFTGIIRAMPALLTRMSSRPNWAMTCSAIWATWSYWDTSTW